MADDRFHPAVGVLRYGMMPDGASKLVVEVERDIAFLARALAPPWFRLRGQRYPPHISVIRHERACDHPLWGAHEGLLVPFEYGSYVFDDGRYYWLRVRSQTLIDLRLELGLPADSLQSRPPDGTRWFHITVGNTKVIPSP